MSTPFFEKSKEIADRFIQSVLFVDDEIYSDKEDKKYNLDAYELVRAFSRSQKLCALNNPKNEDDFADVIEVAKKADISVLDWKMDLEKADEHNVDETTDVDEDDPRGSFTLKLIEEILLDNEASGSFKLILVYTGEINLPQIVEKIISHFESYDLEQFSDNVVGKQNLKIIVAGKPTLKGRLNHAKELKSWIIDYQEIPAFLLNEFTKMTEGLISNFALECLSTIRNSTFRVLQLFNRDLDAAYLGHKVLLPNPEDAEDLLVDLMRDSIGDLLHYSELSKSIDSELINLWIAENALSNKKSFLNKKGKSFKDENGKDLNLNYILTENLFYELIFGDEADVKKRYENIFKKTDGFKKLNKEQKSEFLNNIQNNSSSLFSGDQEDYQEKDLEFAKLTHHKNLFKPSKFPPKLSLGVVVKGTIKDDSYWVCIQQKCDCERLLKGEIRNFLFLPLKTEKPESGNGFHFIDPHGQRLRLIAKSHWIRTIKFQDNDGKGVIIGEEDNEKFIFKQYYSKGQDDYKPGIDENFEWVFDLKDLHAQRISNDIAREISRVGLDESEWLRRWST